MDLKLFDLLDVVAAFAVLFFGVFFKLFDCFTDVLSATVILHHRAIKSGVSREHGFYVELGRKT